MLFGCSQWYGVLIHSYGQCDQIVATIWSLPTSVSWGRPLLKVCLLFFSCKASGSLRICFSWGKPLSFSPKTHMLLLSSGHYEVFTDWGFAKHLGRHHRRRCQGGSSVSENSGLMARCAGKAFLLVQTGLVLFFWGWVSLVPCFWLTKGV